MSELKSPLNDDMWKMSHSCCKARVQRLEVEITALREWIELIQVEKKFMETAIARQRHIIGRLVALVDDMFKGFVETLEDATKVMEPLGLTWDDAIGDDE